MKSKSTEPELSRPLRVEKIPAKGIEETIVARPSERATLADRFGLIEITDLRAQLTITPKQTGLNFAVEGSLTADITQRCVVTLEPLPSHIEQQVKAYFTTQEPEQGGNAEQPLDDEDREPITNGIIDLGELVAQHLGLALDPYPRKPGLPPVTAEFGAPTPENHPFAKLASLKDKPKK